MQLNFQDAFLGALKKEGQIALVYLAKGVQLKGYVRGFDNFTVFLEDAEGRMNMVYKHSITTVTPSRPLSLSFLGEAFSAAVPGKAVPERP